MGKASCIMYLLDESINKKLASQNSACLLCELDLIQYCP